MSLFQQLDMIESRPDFAAFVRALRDDLNNNPQAWENHTLDSFLEALSGWVDDMDGYYRNQGRPTPSTPDWKMLGEILMAARTYE